MFTRQGYEFSSLSGSILEKMKCSRFDLEHLHRKLNIFPGRVRCSQNLTSFPLISEEFICIFTAGLGVCHKVLYASIMGKKLKYFIKEQDKIYIL